VKKLLDEIEHLEAKLQKLKRKLLAHEARILAAKSKET